MMSGDSQSEDDYEEFFMNHTGGMSRPPPHEVYELVAGHEWCKPNRLIKWDYCKRCLKIRRSDGLNPPCRGPSRLRDLEQGSPCQSVRQITTESLVKTCSKSAGPDLIAELSRRLLAVRSVLIESGRARADTDWDLAFEYKRIIDEAIMVSGGEPCDTNAQTE